MYTLGAGGILIKSIIFVCLLNLMAWKASWAHRTGENEKKDNDKIKKSVQTSSACGLIRIFTICNTQIRDQTAQTAPRGAVWSGSSIFAILSASFGCITLW